MNFLTASTSSVVLLVPPLVLGLLLLLWDRPYQRAQMYLPAGAVEGAQ